MNLSLVGVQETHVPTQGVHHTSWQVGILRVLTQLYSKARPRTGVVNI